MRKITFVDGTVITCDPSGKWDCKDKVLLSAILQLFKTENFPNKYPSADFSVIEFNWLLKEFKFQIVSYVNNYKPIFRLNVEY